MKASGVNSVKAGDWSGFENQLWSRTWDNCLENKATGKVKHIFEKLWVKMNFRCWYRMGKVFGWKK